MDFEMMQASIQQEKAKKFELLMPKLIEAVKNQDWEEVETLLTLSPDIMAEGLEYAIHICRMSINLASRPIAIPKMETICLSSGNTSGRRENMLPLRNESRQR